MGYRCSKQNVMVTEEPSTSELLGSSNLGAAEILTFPIWTHALKSIQRRITFKEINSFHHE